MLNDLESVIASIENQDPEVISKVKDNWQKAFKNASSILCCPENFIVEYNPAIWRISRFPVGIRLISYPWRNVFIFEFAFPNSRFPLDYFSSEIAKTGVMVHELAHFIDDVRWGFDFRQLFKESRDYVTREQRAELLAFAGCPQGIIEANKCLIESTLIELGYEPTDFFPHLGSIAAVETLGRIGMNRQDDLIRFYRDMEDASVPVHKILKAYISSFIFSLAGLTTAPNLNENDAYGIKRATDLQLARMWLCRYLREKVSLQSLECMLGKLGYKVRVDSLIPDYNPLSCIDFQNLNLKLARDNISSTGSKLRDVGNWRCFDDLRNALEEVDMRLERRTT